MPTIVPRCMTAIRVLIRRTSRRSAVTTIAENSRSCCSRAIWSSTALRTVASMPAVGSSATTSVGSRMSARAIATRCRCPLLSSYGYSSRQLSGRRMPSMSVATSSIASALSNLGSREKIG